MGLLSTKTIAAFLIFSLVLCVLAAFFIPPEGFLQSRLNVFISILASVMVLFIGLSLIFSALTLEKQEETTRISITKDAIDKLWLYPNRLLCTSKGARDVFLKSLYPNNLPLQCLPVSEASVSVFSILEEQNISIVFIQAWEDYLTMRQLDETGDVVWLNNFIQWAQSPYLKEYFEMLKFNFKETTVALGYLLFEYAKKLPIPTTAPESYRTVVAQLQRDPRLQKIYEG